MKEAHVFRKACKTGILFISDMTAYDEKMIGGRLVSRYLNCCGQIFPEIHLDDSKFTDSNDAVFSIEVCGKKLDCGWNVREVREEENETLIALRHIEVPITVEVLTEGVSEGFIKRSLRLINEGTEPLPVTELIPFRGSVFRHVFDNGVFSYCPEESGCHINDLYEVGYAEEQTWGHEGDFYFHLLTPDGLFYDSGAHGRSGWSRPSFTIHDRLNGQFFSVEFAYAGNWKAEIHPVRTENGIKAVFEIGFSTPESEAVRVLMPGETITVPEVYFTICGNGLSALIERRHAFVRHSILPQKDPIGPCRIEANHRGYLCNAENEEGIKQDMEIAAAVGVELYVIDAGWFGRLPNNWFDNAGDWFSGEWLPNDLYPLITYARQLGMKFGLWMEIEAAGSNTDLRRNHPEFILQRYGQPVADGRALDLTNPEVVEYLEKQITDVIERYDLDMFRIDHNHHMLQGGTREIGGYTENLTWRYYENLFAMMDRIRDRFPNVSFQNCAAGGGRLDYMTLSRFHHTEISDWARPPRDIKIFTGMISQLPPEILLRIYGTEVPEHVQSGDAISGLHSILQGRPIIRGIAPSLSEAVPGILSIIKKELEFFKNELRPILLSPCLVTIHEPLQGVMALSSWCANEYAMPDGSKAFGFVQKLTEEAENEYVFRFRHVDAGREYEVMLDREGQKYHVSGKELRDQGVLLKMESCLMTEIVLVKTV